jgi:hypothetical protein
MGAHLVLPELSGELRVDQALDFALVTALLLDLDFFKELLRADSIPTIRGEAGEKSEQPSAAHLPCMPVPYINAVI